MFQKSDKIDFHLQVSTYIIEYEINDLCSYFCNKFESIDAGTTHTRSLHLY